MPERPRCPPPAGSHGGCDRRGGLDDAEAQNRLGWRPVGQLPTHARQCLDFGGASGADPQVFVEAASSDAVELVVEVRDELFLVVAEECLAHDAFSVVRDPAMPRASRCRRNTLKPLIQARLDGAERAALHVRNLLKRQPVILLQDDGRALLLGQVEHGFAHRLAQLIPGHQVLDRLQRALGAGELDNIYPFRRRHNRRPSLTTNPVAAQVEGDAIEPGRELRLALEPGERAKGAEKGFLADIPRVLVAPDDPVGQGINRPFPAEDELVEAVSIARDRAGHELFVC